MLYTYPPLQASLAGGATEANQLIMIAELEDINTELDTQTAQLTSIDAELVDVNTELDTQTVTLNSIDDELATKLAGSLVPDAFDYIALTYVAAGNGIGEVETATYKSGGAAGSTVATLTLAYDVNDNLATVTKV